MEMTWPRLTSDQLSEYIKAELPGIDFRVEHDNGSYVTVLEWRRRVEGYRAVISDMKNAASRNALPQVTLAAIDAYREKAMLDYGLRAILEREKAEAHREGFRAMVKNLKGYVAQNMTEWIEVLDENGAIQEVKGGPTWEGERLLAWVKTLSSD